jgi:DNA-binding beta-propeller fold protein YncE
MRHARHTLIALVLAVPVFAVAQDAGQPTNDAPNNYNTIKDYFKLPDGRTWGSTSAVDIDKDGKSIWVAERCGQNSCLDRATGKMSDLPSVLKFDASGKLVKSFGAGLLIFPHGIHVDKDGNVWVTDGQDDAPAAARGAGGGRGRGEAPSGPIGPRPGATHGNQVVKFSPDGKVLMTLGKPGVRGNPPEALTDPTDVVTDPANGDIYITESHTDVADPNLIGRISVFDKTGKFLRIIGKTGTGPGEFRTPHAIKFDSKGRLVVADRHNHRIQVLTKTGKFVLEYDDFGRTSGLAIDKNDVIYTADSESTERVHPGWQRGIRIGSLKDGKVTTFIPPHMVPNSADGAMGEGIAIDAAGNVYTAEAQLRGVTKYVRK